MTTFIFQGSLTRNGVDFFIEADSLEEAKTKARLGKYEDRDDSCADSVDWDIWPETGVANE